MKFLKFLLLSIGCFLIFSVAAFAADDVVATVNGEGFSSVSAALAVAQAGDRVEVVADTSFSSNLSIPSGVNFYLNPGVTLSTSSFNISSRGNSFLYGNLVRTSSSSDNSFLFSVYDGTTSVFGSVLDSSSVGTAISVRNNSGNLIFYGGSASGYEYALTANFGSAVIYNGSFSSIQNPDYPLGGSNLSVPGHIVHSGSGSYVSFGGLYEVGQIVSSAISWLNLFVIAIVTNKLLLIFFIIIFVGVGIGLIKRICRS